MTAVPPFAVAVDDRGCAATRAPNFEAENRALAELTQTLTRSPGEVLQKLATVALNLCQAHSAGISVLEEDGRVFRWRALAGKLASHLGFEMPRTVSPCATAFDCNSLHLISRPARLFSSMEALSPRIEEMLLVPFYVNGEPVGTLWVASHDDTRPFDAEDARLIESLGKFGGAACEVSALRSRLDADLAERHAAAVRLEKEVGDRDRLMAILGHELRSQLGAGSNAAALLRCETLDVAAKHYSVGIIERMVHDITRIVGDLLDVTRVRAGIIELQRTGVVLGDVVQRALEVASPAILAGNHALVVNAPAEPIRIEADPLWLAHALQNVIGNAAKYTAPGGRISVELRRDGVEAVVSVSDSGMGIPAAELESIFDLYMRGQQAAKLATPGGLGIGLYLVRRVVEGHGGSIRATSAGAGGGSEFTLRFPCGAPLRTQAAV